MIKSQIFSYWYWSRNILGMFSTATVMIFGINKCLVHCDTAVIVSVRVNFDTTMVSTIYCSCPLIDEFIIRYVSASPWRFASCRCRCNYASYFCKIVIKASRETLSQYNIHIYIFLSKWIQHSCKLIVIQTFIAPKANVGVCIVISSSSMIYYIEKEMVIFFEFCTQWI